MGVVEQANIGVYGKDMDKICMQSFVSSSFHDAQLALNKPPAKSCGRLTVAGGFVCRVELLSVLSV